MRNQTATKCDTTCPDPRTVYEDRDGSMFERIREIQEMSVKELQQLHLELYGISTRSKHRQQLAKRLCWKVQADKWGDLSDDVVQRLREIEDDRDARFLPPRSPQPMPAPPPRRAPSLPPVGSVIEREHQGAVHRVTVLDKGFEYGGRHFRSLSAIAREITGGHWSGPRFFGLQKAKGSRCE